MTRYLFATVVILAACKVAASQPEPESMRPDELARLGEFVRCLNQSYNNGLPGSRSAEAFCNAEAVRRALLEVGSKDVR